MHASVHHYTDLLSAPAQADGVLSEFWNLVLLTTLYAMQGVPLGLTMGAM